jgi:hypothetical protein
VEGVQGAACGTASMAGITTPVMTKRKLYAEDGVRMGLVAKKEFHAPRMNRRDSGVNLTRFR